MCRRAVFGYVNLVKSTLKIKHRHLQIKWNKSLKFEKRIKEWVVLRFICLAIDLYRLNTLYILPVILNS